MSPVFLSLFLLASMIGAACAWRVPSDRIPDFLAVLLLASSACIVGALTIAAETASAAARYFGLAALIIASASFCGNVVITRRAKKSQSSAPRP